MTMVEVLLLILILIVLVVNLLESLFARRATREWSGVLENILKRDLFERPFSPMVRESLKSLENSVSSLSQLSEKYAQFILLLEERWPNPEPRCSERETIQSMDKTLKEIAQLMMKNR